MAGIASHGVEACPAGARFSAQCLTLIFIFTKIVFLVVNCTRWTDALEAAKCILALSPVAYESINFTLILVHTVLPCYIYLVARVADATICPDKVFACTIATNIRVLGTFVDVGATIGETRAVGTELVKLCGPNQGARGARRTPAHRV